MESSLNQKFTFLSLIKYAIPSMISSIFMSFYSMVDGVFVSILVNTDALSAVNIIYPVINIIIGLGLMLSTGGSAMVAKKLGEQKFDEANKNFTMIISMGAILGTILGVLGFVFRDTLVILLGGESLYTYCIDYLTPLTFLAPFFIINLLFQILLMTAGKPQVGLLLTVSGGIINIVLDYIFIVPMDMGIMGASLATGLGNSIPGIIALLYFLRGKEIIKFTKFKFNKKTLFEVCGNGSSEMVSNLSTGITTLLYNLVMMKLLGADGVAAITIVLYAQFFMTAVYMGYSSGVAPLISYNYGHKNIKELQNIIKYSYLFLILASLISLVATFLMRAPLVTIFAPQESNVYNIAYDGLSIFGLSFIFTGINIFTSSMFTAFSNGRVSAIISFLRSFVFIVLGVISLPMIIGVDGVWFAIVVAEMLSMLICLYYINKYKDVYEYRFKLC